MKLLTTYTTTLREPKLIVTTPDTRPWKTYKTWWLFDKVMIYKKEIYNEYNTTREKTKQVIR